MIASVVTPRASGGDLLGQIQAPVVKELELVMAEMHRVLTTDLPMIEQVSAHLFQRRGKLFRPTLALLASRVDGAGEQRAVAVAAVVELMHMASLVHDDSVDHSVLRRGLPTVNSLFSHQVSVIMGDFLYSRALTALVALRDLEIIQLLTEVSNQLTIGEMRQLGAIDVLSFTEQEYCELIYAKTASLIAAACETGSLCGAAGQRRALQIYGKRLGMAFQVADDILDYTEDQAMTGKPSGADLREHKVTLPLIAALHCVSPAARRRVDELFHDDAPDDEMIADVIGIVADAGGIEYARRSGERFAREAVDALDSVPTSAARTALVDAVTFVMDRRS